MSLIRNYIRTLLAEGMIPPSSVSGKYAMWTNYEKFPISSHDGGNQYYFMIIDYEGLLERMDEIHASLNFDTEAQEEYENMDVEDKVGEYDEAVYEHIVAMLRVKTSSESCNFAWEVERSAANEGLGPTLYDMVMSISPNGLVSDRNSVSNAALKYWKYSANYRGDIDKKFLDTLDNKYTVDPTDNCTLHGDGDDSEGLIKYASRRLAIEFFNLFHNEIHEYVMNNVPMYEITQIGSLDGDGYVDAVVGIAKGFVKDRAANFSDFADDIQYIAGDWETYKIENEHDMFDNFVEDDLESRESILNLSYNTDYASGDYQKLVQNFEELFEVEAAPLIGDEVFHIIFVDRIIEYGNQFFDDKYYPE